MADRPATGHYAGLPFGTATECSVVHITGPRALRDALEALAESLDVPKARIARAALAALLGTDGASLADRRRLLWALRDSIDGTVRDRLGEEVEPVDPRQLPLGGVP